MEEVGGRMVVRSQETGDRSRRMGLGKEVESRTRQREGKIKVRGWGCNGLEVVADLFQPQRGDLALARGNAPGLKGNK